MTLPALRQITLDSEFATPAAIWIDIGARVRAALSIDEADRQTDVYILPIGAQR